MRRLKGNRGVTRVSDICCPECGQIMPWLRQDPPLEECFFCGQKLSSIDENGRRVWRKDVIIFPDGSLIVEIMEAWHRKRERFLCEVIRNAEKLEDETLAQITITMTPVAIIIKHGDSIMKADLRDLNNGASITLLKILKHSVGKCALWTDGMTWPCLKVVGEMPEKAIYAIKALLKMRLKSEEVGELIRLSADELCEVLLAKFVAEGEQI